MFLCVSSCFYSCLVWFGSLCMLAPPGPVPPSMTGRGFDVQTDFSRQPGIRWSPHPQPFRLFQARSCLSSLLAALPLTMRLYRPCRTVLDSPAIPAQRAKWQRPSPNLQHILTRSELNHVQSWQMTASLVHPSWVIRLAWTFGISFPNSSCMAVWCSLRAGNPRIWPLYPPVEILWDFTKPFNNFCPGWIFESFESLRHPKRVASLLKHLQERQEAHFRLLTCRYMQYIKLHQARFISVLYETVKHLLVNVFWTTETCQMLFDLIAAGR